MGRDLHQAVQHLRAATSLLNQNLDEAGATVRAVEDFLNDECNVGIPASVTVSAGTDNDSGISFGTELSYIRIGPRFRVAVTRWNDANPEDSTIKPWSDCTREIKMEAIRKLPELLVEVANQLDEHLKEAQAAIATAKSVLGALRTGKVE